jgi:hypothetical protein
MELRIALQQLERELESARAESWELRQRASECQKRLEMNLSEPPETDHR